MCEQSPDLREVGVVRHGSQHPRVEGVPGGERPPCPSPASPLVVHPGQSPHGHHAEPMAKEVLELVWKAFRAGKTLKFRILEKKKNQIIIFHFLFFSFFSIFLGGGGYFTSLFHYVLVF